MFFLFFLFLVIFVGFFGVGLVGWVGRVGWRSAPKARCRRREAGWFGGDLEKLVESVAGLGFQVFGVSALGMSHGLRMGPWFFSDQRMKMKSNRSSQHEAGGLVLESLPGTPRALSGASLGAKASVKTPSVRPGYWEIHIPPHDSSTYVVDDTMEERMELILFVFVFLGSSFLLLSVLLGAGCGLFFARLFFDGKVTAEHFPWFFLCVAFSGSILMVSLALSIYCLISGHQSSHKVRPLEQLLVAGCWVSVLQSSQSFPAF